MQVLKNRNKKIFYQNYYFIKSSKIKNKSIRELKKIFPYLSAY